MYLYKPVYYKLAENNDLMSMEESKPVTANFAAR